MDVKRLSVEEYEKEFGFSPIRLLNMFYEQKHLLIDAFASLQRAGIISNEVNDDLLNEYTQLVFKHFPEIHQSLSLPQDESQNDEN